MRASRQADYHGSVILKALAFLSLSIVGCGGGLTTYPVNGKVVFKGGRPVTNGGRIEFQSVSDPQVKANGWIEDTDGSFSLTTYREGKSVEGAVVGEHRVAVELGSPGAVVNLPGPYRVEPRDNELTIELPMPPAKRLTR